MFGIRDPWALAAISIGLTAATAALATITAVYREAIVALIGNLVVRPVYLAKLKFSKTCEWEQFRHSREYIVAYKRDLAEIEKFLRREEPELVIS